MEQMHWLKKINAPSDSSHLGLDQPTVLTHLPNWSDALVCFVSDTSATGLRYARNLDIDFVRRQTKSTRPGTFLQI